MNVHDKTETASYCISPERPNSFPSRTVPARAASAVPLRPAGGSAYGDQVIIKKNAAMSAGLRCVGVIGPNNAPVHITTFGETENDANAYLHVLHCALDEVELRSAGGGGGASASSSTDQGNGNQTPPGNPGATSGHQTSSSQIQKDPFLGMVFPTEQDKVFAYKTNTRAVFLLVYDDSFVQQESDIKLVFAKIHDAYAEAMSNPFAAPNARIDSAKFCAEMRGLCTD